MRYSLNWLNQYIDIELDVEELAKRLTMTGFEVEQIERQADKYRGFYIGQVVDVFKHPNAINLKVCNVNIGKETIQIVCGAPNVTSQQYVVVGVPGAVIPKNLHEHKDKPFTLSTVEIRGIESKGMICSQYELDLGEDKSGIMVLDGNYKIGMPLSTSLGLDDIIFHINLTPNRPDAMSHIGLAREIAAITNKKLRIPRFKLKESSLPINKFAKVNVVDIGGCPRYSAKVLFDIKISTSPIWLQRRLTAVGIRPINNVVDATNYVLMEIGHPLHAFDYEKIENKTIVVKSIENKRSFVTLDGKKRELDCDTLLICDANKELAIAGIMGGENSEISSSTQAILLESAYFNPSKIRRTSKYLSLVTEASQRFERGTDPNITKWAADRAAYLIEQLTGAKICKGTIDIYPKKIYPTKIFLRIKKLNDILGTNLSKNKVLSYLNKIEIKKVKDLNKSDKIYFKVPTFRPDIQNEIDLIEEVARIFGYENINTKTRTIIDFSDRLMFNDVNRIIKDWFVGRGFFEIVTNSLTDSKTAEIVTDEIIKISNPISIEMDTLRSSLVPSMLNIVRSNIYKGSVNLRLFEIGKIYKKNLSNQKNLFIEEEKLILCISGQNYPITWDSKPCAVDIFYLKGEIEAFFDKIFLDNYKFIPYPYNNALTKYGLYIEINDSRIGYIGAVADEILKQYDIEKDVYIAELNIEDISPHVVKKKTYTELPKYPQVIRDLAIVVDEIIPVEQLINEIKSSGGKLLKNIQLFDIYRGNQIEKGKKSCAFTMRFLSEERTLLQEEVDEIISKMVESLTKKFKASLRM